MADEKTDDELVAELYAIERDLNKIIRELSERKIKVDVNYFCHETVGSLICNQLDLTAWLRK